MKSGFVFYMFLEKNAHEPEFRDFGVIKEAGK